MIERIELQNFKCFKRINLDLGMLNIFSGINGMGKSTIIQSILLLRQSKLQGLLPEKISLNGEYVNIGTGRDLLYENAETETIEIKIFEDSVLYSYRPLYNSESDTLLLIDNADCCPSISKDCFEYLNAERISPKVIYPKSSYHVNSLMQLGINGQYSIHYLLNHEDDMSNLRNPDNEFSSIKSAMQFWLNEICPGVKIEVQNIENTDLAKIGYYYIEGQKSNIVRPTNIGFGLSYILPVILSLVKASKDSTLIIENPEAHLHPKGQRKIGELIAMCASNGVQVFIETHSDHVLNGIRIGVKNKLINKDLVKLFYFRKQYSNMQTDHIVDCPYIKENGKLDHWPEGFFDEWEKALDEIL